MMGVLIERDALMISLIRGTPRVICEHYSQGMFNGYTVACDQNQ